jgi:hypothetical protein
MLYTYFSGILETLVMLSVDENYFAVAHLKILNHLHSAEERLAEKKKKTSRPPYVAVPGKRKSFFEASLP